MGHESVIQKRPPGLAKKKISDLQSVTLNYHTPRHNLTDESISQQYPGETSGKASSKKIIERGLLKFIQRQKTCNSMFTFSQNINKLLLK